MNSPRKKRLSNKSFVNKLMKNPEFKAEYDALAPEFDLLETMIKARMESGLSQEEVAKKMDTKTSVVGRLETAGGKKQHSPSLRTLQRYAAAVNCKIKIDFVKIKKIN